MSRVLVDPNHAVVPDLAHELLARDDLALLAHEHPQQVELLGGELQLLLVEEGPSGLRVDPHDGAGRRRVVGAAPEQGPHPGQQLGQPEGLGDVVVGTRVEPDHRVDLVGARGEDEDRDRPAVGADPPADLQPVDVRQPQVQDHQVGALVGALERCPSVGADVDVVALAPQRTGEWLGDGRVVFGQQDSGHVRIVDGRTTRSPGPRRSAFLGKGSNAFLAVAGERRRTPAAVLHLQPGGEVDVGSEPHRPLGLAQTDRRVGGDRGGDLHRPGPRGSRRHDLVHHPERTGLGGRHPACGEDQVPAARDQPTRRVSSWVPPPPGMTPTLTPPAGPRRRSRRRRPGRRTGRSPARRRGRSRPPRPAHGHGKVQHPAVRRRAPRAAAPSGPRR